MDFYYDISECKRGPSLIRFLNVSPGTLPLDIYSDADMLEHPVYYGEITEYRSIRPGSHIIRAFSVGKAEGALENKRVVLAPESIYTFAIGDFEKTGLLVVPEPDIRPPYGRALIRVVHLSPIAVPIDILLPCGTGLFKGVNYEEVTEYIDVDPDLTTLFVKMSHADKIIYKTNEICLEPEGVYTIYTSGLLGNKPKFNFMLIRDRDPEQFYE